MESSQLWIELLSQSKHMVDETDSLKSLNGAFQMQLKTLHKTDWKQQQDTHLHCHIVGLVICFACSSCNELQLPLGPLDDKSVMPKFLILSG